MTSNNPIAAYGDDAVNRFILAVTIPLFADVDSDNPIVLGTGTLFRHEDRLFIVTASHILKEDESDLSSPDIDYGRIAFPLGLIKAQTHTLGSIHVLRPEESSNVDLAVIEIRDEEVIAEIGKVWRTIGFDQVAPFPVEGLLDAPFMVNGYLLEGSSVKDGNIGQKFLALGTVCLNYTPLLPNLIPNVDRFLLLEDVGELPDGEKEAVPRLKGMSGASVWTLNKIEGLWDPSIALKVVGVQTSVRRGQYVRCADWSAVMAIFRSEEVGFRTPP